MRFDAHGTDDAEPSRRVIGNDRSETRLTPCGRSAANARPMKIHFTA
jgi:hypothetical protein